MILKDISEYLRQKSDRDPNFHMVGDGGGLPAEAEIEPERFGFRRSAVVEGNGRFFVRVVPNSDDSVSGFTHFLDGIQKTRLVGYQGIVPLVYGFTAAVIRERDGDRRLGVWGEAVVEEYLYVPLDDLDAAELERCGIPVRDTARSMPDGDGPHPARYRQAAINAIQRARADAESRLARLWVQESHVREDFRLFVDGSLTFATQHARVVGVVKSHQTQYFPASEQSAVLRLEQGERTAVFQPGFGEAKGGDVYSWYLRLHPFAGKDLTHGLVRIEVDRRAEVVDEADAISSWLLTERQPLSAPDPRWDKLFYPIRDCEEYLRSIAPSATMMEAFLGG